MRKIILIGCVSSKEKSINKAKKFKKLKQVESITNVFLLTYDIDI